ncbi:hypothetical protein DSCO28_18750 [Desulfosarcina ovata subsp. sediminis]|uniref:Polysaccharide pyruvyl transferase domain-containing protein n=1 Tax=Desulfosarcina ovata subsp. sediminis TaxID=885957 RepID=A0A5K7ZNP6_9BACT|nr:polysaccharide pyruvyl transferase family protein [Desulfosarcina ovata]BBO81309.1 hypothetical protein DSCO28_18750 [Desulfosarcina ovata subsp. sediminis]
MNSLTPQKSISILILGASFATGNLGVNALAWSCIKIIRFQWPNAKILLLGADRLPDWVEIQLDDCKEKFRTLPIRYCANLIAQNHISGLWMAILLSRYFAFLKHRFSMSKTILGELLGCDVICDITGGDSFSDIYGLSRFIRGYMLKRACQMTGKPFIMLPQTYGPFKNSFVKRLATKVLIHSDKIFSRDKEGLDMVEKLIGASDKIKLCPDVAFIMDAIRPDCTQTLQLEELKTKGIQLIGLNVSGLLYNGGYTRNNMFGLSCNYPALVEKIIHYFSQQPNQHILLVSHVLPSDEFSVENDFIACKKALKTLPEHIKKQVTVLEKGYNQNETKYLIGLCDFFLGSRMHSTIASLSKAIPAVGMAYSKKFNGVFETAGVSDCVLDLRELNNEQIMTGIKNIYNRREELHLGLKRSMPEIKSRIFNLFNDISWISAKKFAKSRN